MAYKDFREFLEVLKEKGELIEINRKVALDLEVGKALRKSAAISGPALIFNQNGTKFPLVGGIYNSRSKALLAFQSNEEDLFKNVLDGLKKPIAPIKVSKGPAQENILTGEKIDLSALPIPKYSPADGGAYITPGIVVSQDPETGIPDLGNYRFQVMDKKTLSFLAQPNHRFGKHIAKARKMGLKTYSVALVLGVDPILAYTCQFQVSDTTNDYEVAGGLRREAVQLIPCTTSNVLVPAFAEFVLELEIDLTKNIFEGPLGEYTGYYTPGSLKPIANVKAITHRNDAFFQALLTGVPPTENHVLKQIPFEASFFNTMKEQFPTLKKLAFPLSGGVSFYLVMGLEPRFAGEARQAILAAMASNVRPKVVIVVNTDIDVHNSTEVEWAVSFRMQPEEDTIIVKDIPAGPLDPSILDSIPLDSRVASSIGIDATYPFGSIVDDGSNRDGSSNLKETKGVLYFKVAEVPGWQTYDFPELDKARRGS
ncbi:UbiD family decarboxylase [Criblamydia sequanensis]|uniref:3-octaprenyl-4-hydroxybenzoate carboxy-lyase n=1 Tax=Candidatus Criblamydia sequanensis CRIB-18 TaxID=1437425 RepID=A0A090D3D0_9BACT|nr:UbiD family decarboxylase [Criblamydia sequanensis]CDR35168.1 3-octaprenyl-4-hydroxybenzoate carboxy-lyase [Criblamydia sequanensis CRIB-18]